MLDLVTQAFKENELLLIEAPTGVGKTFAYGIPSIITSIQTGKSVYISTNTKTLQDQIFEKDIPAMRELCRAQGIEDFSVTKIKGRSNYLSLFLFFEYLESDIREEIEYIVVAKLLFCLELCSNEPAPARPRAFSVFEKTLARSAKMAFRVASRHARSCRFGQK